jgi:signal transduction histidine kinase
MVTLPIDNSPIPQILLQVAVPMTLLDDQIASRKFLFEISLPLALLIAVLGGYFLSMRAMRPVTEMIATANAISAEKLQERLPVPLVRDEIQGLALSLNKMLSRIEKAFSSQERFIADASHQLLTPLTIIRGEIESLLRQPKIEISKPVSELLQSNLQEVDQLSTIVQQLLLLARVDAGKGALQLSELALDEVILDAISRANRFAQQKKIRIQFNIDNQTNTETRPMIKGDYDLLQNMAFNLIENAIKYSPENEVVKVTVVWEKDTQKFSVADHGKGIPKDQLNLIFERFHRADNSSKGYGLGLAIAKKISDVHGAKLGVENNYSKEQGNSNILGCCFLFEIKNI